VCLLLHGKGGSGRGKERASPQTFQKERIKYYLRQQGGFFTKKRKKTLHIVRTRHASVCPRPASSKSFQKGSILSGGRKDGDPRLSPLTEEEHPRLKPRRRLVSEKARISTTSLTGRDNSRNPPCSKLKEKEGKKTLLSKEEGGATRRAAPYRAERRGLTFEEKDGVDHLIEKSMPASGKEIPQEGCADLGKRRELFHISEGEWGERRFLSGKEKRKANERISEEKKSGKGNSPPLT